MKAQGTIKKINQKRLGKNVFYSFFLDGDDNMYRTSFDPVDANEGDFVEFNYEEDKYGLQVAMESVVKQAAAPQGSPTTKKTTSGGGSGNKDGYWEQKAIEDKERQISIMLQSATKDAINIVDLALKHEAISLGAKKADKLGIIMQTIYETSEELFLFYTNALEYNATLQRDDSPEAVAEVSETNGVDDD